MLAPLAVALAMAIPPFAAVFVMVAAVSAAVAAVCVAVAAVSVAVAEAFTPLAAALACVDIVKALTISTMPAML